MSENILVNKIVLVAEDNAINQMVVKHTLIKLGASADIAADGAEAIEKYKTNDYDLVLMDVQMPKMDGYEATRFIRNQLHSNVPIIAMTAFALIGEEEKCLECGMNGYVSKPFTLDSLQAEIQKVFSVPLQVNSNPNVLVMEDVAVDISMLYDIAGDDKNFIDVMVQTFLQNMPNTLQKLEQSILEKDWDNVYRLAHFAKSSLSVIKVTGMLEGVRQIETDARNRAGLASIPGTFAGINAHFKLAEQALNQKFKPAHQS